jgi:arabinogalactan endo-1,4-beta-galactosidase
MMKLLIPIVFALCISCSKGSTTSIPEGDATIKGADLSFLPEIEGSNIPFFDPNGVKNDMLSILKQAGCNTIRLRLWHSPADGHSGFQEVANFAARIKSAGLKIWLDIHYSDTWADPAHQTKPDKWINIDKEALKDSVYQYTYRVVSAIKPEIVQIGNEINNGFLWPSGNLSDQNNQANFIELLKSGTKGARSASPSSLIMLHFAGIEGSPWFFESLIANNIDYDLVGLSFYPYYHGKDFALLSSTLSRLKKSTGKKIFIAETAYPFTLGWNDNTNNVVGQNSQLMAGYSATPSGQKEFISALIKSIKSAGGDGFCYWGGEWVAFKGSQATNGSSWENQALFDFNNKALPVLDNFRQ